MSLPCFQTNRQYVALLCMFTCLQVAGLWYIQGIALGIALLLTAVKRIQYHFWLKGAKARRATKQQQEEAAAASSVSALSSPNNTGPPGDGVVEDKRIQMLSLDVKQQRAHAYVHAHATSTRLSPLGAFSSSGNADISSDGQHGDCLAEITLPPGGVESHEGGTTATAAAGRHMPSTAALDTVGGVTAVQQALRSEAALDSS
jgi:hypothetical protein